MDYIAVLDYKHLDNGVFLSAFAKSLASQKEYRGLIIHGDSEYTDRLIQTGMMREDAEIRAIKDLNHRLIALFADYGVSAIGLNAYQRSLVSLSENALSVDVKQLHNLPAEPHLLISNLVANNASDKPEPLPLDQFASALANKLSVSDLYVFSLEDSEEFINHSRPGQITVDQIDKDFSEKYIPQEFKKFVHSFYLTTARDFGNYPQLKNSTEIKMEL